MKGLLSPGPADSSEAGRPDYISRKAFFMNIKLSYLCVPGLLVFGTLLGLVTLLYLERGATNAAKNQEESNMIDAISTLPTPQKDSRVSIEETLANRRSVREFTREEISLEDIAQLLWAAQGITHPAGKRTAPSAGATYPLELYIIAERVSGLEPGVYHYVPQEHQLTRIAAGHLAGSLSAAALGQVCIEEAAVNIVVTAVYERTLTRYGGRGRRYVHMEAGHAGQNIYLQCESLGLGAVVIGAFHDQQIQDVMRLPGDHEPLYLIPVGKKRF